MAYSENEELIRRLSNGYKEALWFGYNLKEALDIIDSWHKAMYNKNKVGEFENLRAGMASNFSLIQDQIETEKKGE